MFASWFGGGKGGSSVPAPLTPRRTAIFKEQHVEVIGGGSGGTRSHDDDDLHWPSPRSHPDRRSPQLDPPRLPPEISLLCAYLAGLAIVGVVDADGGDDMHDTSGPSSTRLLLNVAAVNRAWYACVMTHFILPSISLDGGSQVAALHASLSGNAVLRGIFRDKTRRLAVGASSSGAQRDLSAGVATRRSSLYDFLARLSAFDKAAKPYVRAMLARASALEELHLEMSPDVLRYSGGGGGGGDDDGDDVRHTLRSLSFLLSAFGGVGCEDVFVGAAKVRGGDEICGRNDNKKGGRGDGRGDDFDGNENGGRANGVGDDDDGRGDNFDGRVASPPPRSPWSSLSHLQISGPAGFRVSMATASSLGSLPSLTHLCLVMPNIVRDAGMRGEMNATPPAALHLLVLLLADQLEELVVVSHTLEGYMGWHGTYEHWLSVLQLPASARARRRNEGAMRIKLVVASVGGGDGDGDAAATAHPNHFTSWMIKRAQRGLQWQWGEGGGGCEGNAVDRQFGVRFSVREWQVPFAEEDEPQRQGEAADPQQSGWQRRRRTSSRSSRSSRSSLSDGLAEGGFQDLDEGVGYGHANGNGNAPYNRNFMLGIDDLD